MGGAAHQGRCASLRDRLRRPLTRTGAAPRPRWPLWLRRGKSGPPEPRAGGLGAQCVTRGGGTERARCRCACLPWLLQPSDPACPGCSWSRASRGRILGALALSRGGLAAPGGRIPDPGSDTPPQSARRPLTEPVDAHPLRDGRRSVLAAGAACGRTRRAAPRGWLESGSTRARRAGCASWVAPGGRPAGTPGGPVEGAPGGVAGGSDAGGARESRPAAAARSYRGLISLGNGSAGGPHAPPNCVPGEARCTSLRDETGQFGAGRFDIRRGPLEIGHDAPLRGAGDTSQRPGEGGSQRPRCRGRDGGRGLVQDGTEVPPGQRCCGG